ncbi:MAG: helix-turn-helix domain-containing protein [Bacteroidaceae bacterium]|nr:helix-turn-helix domain-containing protein [Bacteroidaceae bacterium]
MKSVIESHPMLSMIPQIDKRGLMVFDVNSMPIYGEPYKTSYMVLALNLEGWIRAECDMRPVCFRQRDIAVLPPRHILCAHESSADYHAILIVMSKSFQEARKQDSTNTYRDNFHYLTKPHVSLTEEQFPVVRSLFAMLDSVSRESSPSRNEILTHLLNVLFLLLQDYRRENGIADHEPSAQEQLFANFYQAITQHYAQSREVRFYADLFNLSPKYFATIIKQHTHTNALEWINGYVTVQAKVLLRYHKQLTIQEIALKLGFPDQASFSRFFKSRCGMSPTEYR